MVYEAMRDAFTSTRTITDLPRLPLKGSIDLTYRCNNRCRHCWLWTDKSEGELSTEEIFDIVDQARAMGCREWAISGGEPMLRPDFAEIFDYITSRSRTYSLNTNGTLITPEIAQLMTRKGSKMVALYGATADVHDHITRKTGSFAATMRGISLLKEAGAGFTIQIVPMKDNYHQLRQMKSFAESLAVYWRIGASWLFLSAEQSPARNAEIAAQRLAPRQAVELEMPGLPTDESGGKGGCAQCSFENDRLFAACIETRRDFHVDPTGMLSFCGYVKDSALRTDLRKGTFKSGWDEFIPSLADKIRGGDNYRENCASCEERILCRWCPVFGYLEHGQYDEPVKYLCDMTRITRDCIRKLERDNRRFFQIGGITIQVDSDLPFTPTTLDAKFESFSVDGPGQDTINIRLHFTIPDFPEEERGKEVYRKPPWAIYRKGNSWLYAGIQADPEDASLHQLAIFSDDHTSADLFSERGEFFRQGGVGSLTMFPTDQILIARLLSDRAGVFVHSCGAVMDGKGLLFVGHSGAGKSTMAELIAPHGPILCDDRNIVRHYGNKWHVFGSWSHGDFPDVSSLSVPLNAILFIEQASGNRISRLDDRREIVRRLLGNVIRPFVTVDWWNKTLTVIERLVNEVACYRLEFDKSGGIVEELRRL